MPLSDVAIRNAKPKEKPYKLTDGDGLCLLVNTNGSKWWRFRYRFEGKEKLLSLGVYPDTGLKEARQRRDEARKLVASGVDPSEKRKATKTAQIAEVANTFAVVAKEWYGKHEKRWVHGYASKIQGYLDNDLIPGLPSNRPIAEITPPELLAVLRRIEERGALDTAHRVRQICSQIWRYAIATGRVTRDIAADLRGVLPPVRQSHFAAVTDPKAIGELLRAIDGYHGDLTTRCALKLAPLVFVRPVELRTAEWAHIDLDKAEWNIPAERMKMREPHLVPLSTQAIAILRELEPYTGNGRYVFPSARTRERPMSENAVLAAPRRMGFSKEEMTGHGFRAMARTVLDEELHVRPDYIEHQLAHAVRDPNGRAYNRTAHLAERRKMMQLWADHLERLKKGATIIPLKTPA